MERGSGSYSVRSMEMLELEIVLEHGSNSNLFFRVIGFGCRFAPQSWVARPTFSQFLRESHAEPIDRDNAALNPHRGDNDRSHATSSETSLLIGFHRPPPRERD